MLDLGNVDIGDTGAHKHDRSRAVIWSLRNVPTTPVTPTESRLLGLHETGSIGRAEVLPAHTHPVQVILALNSHDRSGNAGRHDGVRRHPAQRTIRALLQQGRGEGRNVSGNAGQITRVGDPFAGVVLWTRRKNASTRMYKPGQTLRCLTSGLQVFAPQRRASFRLLQLGGGASTVSLECSAGIQAHSDR